MTLRPKNEHSDRYMFSYQWKMGSCYGPKDTYGTDTNIIYVERCCLAPGQYLLNCANDKGPYGWGKSYLEIQGQRYCDDFVGYKATRTVFITGKNQDFKIS